MLEFRSKGGITTKGEINFHCTFKIIFLQSRHVITKLLSCGTKPVKKH